MAGNTAHQSLTFHIDMTAPAITINEPANGSYIAGTAPFNTTIADASPITVSVSVDGMPVDMTIFDTILYPDGPHTVMVSAVDAAGNGADEAITIIVDNTPPSVSILEPSDNEAIRQIRDILADVYDQYLDGITLFINDEAVSYSDRHTFNTSAYPDGIYIISAEAVDLANNTGFDNISVLVDNTRPVVNVTSPVKGSFVRGIVTVDADIQEANIATIQVAVDGILLSEAVPAVWDTSDYPDGNHTIGVYVTDTAGNEAFASVSVVVDNTPPAVVITFPLNNSAIRDVVSITSYVFDSNLVNMTMAIDGMIVSNTTSYLWDTNDVTEKRYTVTMTALDLAGNIGRDEIQVEVDNTPPELIVNELTDNPTLYYPEYLMNGTVESDAILTVNGIVVLHNETFEHTINVTEGINIITVIATDAAGNEAFWTNTRMVDGDFLPDYYELNITLTDPLNEDSDSMNTSDVNESSNGILDDLEDFDNDGLATYAEFELGSNPFLEDTDNDGLNDSYEFFGTGTSLIEIDSDRDGIPDGDEDLDHDSLTNLEEQTYRINPRNEDTDHDSLSDYDEIFIYFTDPLSMDTDGDGLTDNIEIALGNADPLNPDSDNNGIVDGNDTFVQTFENISLGASMEVIGAGNLQESFVIEEEKSPYVPLTMLPGVVGDFIEFTASEEIESAKVRIYYDEAMLNGTNESNLKLYYFNETTGVPVEAPIQYLDTTNNFVEASTDHLSMWFIADDSYWGSWSDTQWNHPETIYSVGDIIDIRAVVHNYGNTAVTDSFPVRFYDRDPSSGAVPFDTVWVTFDVPADGSAVVISDNYLVKQVPFTVYVAVDLYNYGSQNYVEETTESYNNLASRSYPITSDPTSIDSDGDGLTDAEETGGMRIQYPYRALFTNPYEADSDGDGLTDGEEMGSIAYDYYGRPYYKIVSHPRMVYSDGDSLDDYTEVKEFFTVSIVNTRSNALNFIQAIYTNDDAYQYITEKRVKTDALKTDSDNDKLDDGIELSIGTNPRDWDSDDDLISDYDEELFGEYPTVFDITPPKVTLDWGWWERTSVLDFTSTYYMWYTITDAAGVREVKIFKNGIQKDSNIYYRRLTTVQEFSTFESSYISDLLRSARIDVYAKDWNGNEGSTLIYHNPAIYAQLAKSFGSDTIYDQEIARTLGVFTGLTTGAAEIPDLAAQMMADPVGYFNGIKEIAEMLLADPALMVEMIASLDDSIREMQRFENPYEIGTGNYEEFASGWYAGYFAFAIAITVVGYEVVKAVKTSQQFAQVTAGIRAVMPEIIKLLKTTGGKIIKVIAKKVSKGTGMLPEAFAKLKSIPRMFRARKLLLIFDSDYLGKWSTGDLDDSAKMLDKHFKEKGPGLGFSGEINDLAGKQKFFDEAAGLIKERDGVEIYYQIDKENLAIYKRETRQLVTGNIKGEISTYGRFNEKYINSRVEKEVMIKLNGP